MRTIITSVSELKNIFIEVLLSKTSKVNKVSSTGVLNAISYGIAKIGQKCLKEIAIIEAQLFPEYATGSYLDAVAARYGIFERLGASPSTTYIYIYADEGTVFDKNVVRFVSLAGITFRLDQSVIIGACRYVYAKAYSEQTGLNTNVDAFTITSCSGAPSGFKFCTNEFAASGGRNIESDQELNYRIRNVHNVLATKTLEYLAEIALQFNNNILKFVNLGTYRGRTKLGVYTQNGAALSDNELNVLRSKMQDYLALCDISDSMNTRVEFVNVDYAPIRLNFKIDYDKNLFSADEVYSKIQRQLVSFIDWTVLDTRKNITWADILDIVEHTEGVLSCPASQFFVNDGQNDIKVNPNLLPRFKSCLIYNLEGESLINTQSQQWMPIIYPRYVKETFNLL